MHVQRGFAPDQSAVTVASVMRMTSAMDVTSRTPEGVLTSVVQELRYHGVAGDVWLGDGVNVVLIMGKEHHRFFIEAGWSKGQVQQWLWPRLTEPTRAAHDRQLNLGHPEGILLVAAGGAGMNETWILLPHLAWAMTCAVERPGS
jgi:hypothetical protein